MNGLTIGKLAKATSAKVETVRYYERIGLLGSPARSSGNYRLYDEAALGRLSFVRRARELGFSLDQVRELLTLADDKTRPCGAVDTMAREHLDAIARKISDLEALQRELGGLVESCGHGTVADCRIIDALAPAPSGVTAAI